LTTIWTKLCGLLFWATLYIHLRFDKQLSLSLPQISQKVNPHNISDEICYNKIATYSWRNISMINLLPKYLSSESKINYDNLLQWLLFQNYHYRKRLKYFECVHYLCKQGCTLFNPMQHKQVNIQINYPITLQQYNCFKTRLTNGECLASCLYG